MGLDGAAIDACLARYLAELEAADAEIAIKVEQLPAESRKLVTSHEALGYFADRYGFEVIGTVIPTPSSMAQTNPAQLEELAEIIEHEGIRAIFAETLHSVDDVEGAGLPGRRRRGGHAVHRRPGALGQRRRDLSRVPEHQR